PDGKLAPFVPAGILLTPEERDEMVLHWFAHRLRDLARYRHGNRPRPWADTCATECLQQRDELAGVDQRQGRSPKSTTSRLEVHGPGIRPDVHARVSAILRRVAEKEAKPP